MRISIKNFKSIQQLDGFEIRPLSIVCGVNSSGKSSLIQFLLFLKQTLELESARSPFEVSGPYVKARFTDLLHAGKDDRQMEFRLDFSNDEIPDRKSYREYDLLGLRDESGSWSVDVRYLAGKNRPQISHFEMSYASGESEASKPDQHLLIQNEKEKSIVSNGVFDPLWLEKKSLQNVRFSSIFPIQYEYTSASAGTRPQTSALNVSPAKAAVEAFFAGIEYLGPVRRKPEESVYDDTDDEGLGSEGEHTARTLCERDQERISYYKMVNAGGKATWRRVNGTLLGAVNYWLCEVLGIGKKVYSEKRNDVYRIVIVTHQGLPVSIFHVGFGVSQLLPIVLGGLLMPRTGTLVAEEPESHLHPRLQSLCFDFFYSLTFSGKRVLIETHSDHLLRRMRRRIAEDVNGTLQNKVNLTFVESKGGRSVFERLALDDFGGLDEYPPDFTEISNDELKHLVTAQMQKRIAASKE